MRIKKCENCGRAYKGRAETHFCCRKCYLESVRSAPAERNAVIWEGVTRKAKNGEQRLPHVLTQIVITAEIPVWPQFRPRIGSQLQAEKYVPCKGARIGYVVEVAGKRVCVREDECKEI